ncbi:MAG: hypothetical protein JWN97_2341 [Nocardioides sp.]|nr:hypothetical protein [Nocardioides sp.]
MRTAHVTRHSTRLRGALLPILLGMIASTLISLPAHADSRANRPGERQWTHQMSGEFARFGAVATDPANRTVYVYGIRQPHDSAESESFVRAIHRRTGKTLWTTPAPQIYADVELMVDGTRGHITLSGGYDSPAAVTVLDRQGNLVWQSTGAVGRTLAAVDPTSGQTCTVSQDRGSGTTWTTACWSTEGVALFSDRYESGAGPGSGSRPLDIEIDSATGAVVVLGQHRFGDQNGIGLNRMVISAHSPHGDLLWRTDSYAGPRAQGVDLEINPHNGRIYAFGQVRRSSLFLHGLRADSGQLLFRRTWSAGRKGRLSLAQHLVSLPGSGNLVATGLHGRTLQIVTVNAAGRRVRVARTTVQGDAPLVTQDPRRRVLLAFSPDQRSLVVESYSMRAHRLWRWSTKLRKSSTVMAMGPAALDPRTGRYVVATEQRGRGILHAFEG